MKRTRQRFCLLASLLAPALVFLCSTWRADAQPDGFRFERSWRCSKCGGNLGNGVNPPSTCPRCNAKLRPPFNNNSWPDPTGYPSRPNVETSEPSAPWGRIAAITFVAMAAVALGFLVMKDWSA